MTGREVRFRQPKMQAMRIVSDFKDYYDALAAYDTEPKPRFERVGRVCRGERVRLPQPRRFRWDLETEDEGVEAFLALLEQKGVAAEFPCTDAGVEVVLVGFCGRSHVVFHYAGRGYARRADVPSPGDGPLRLLDLEPDQIAAFTARVDHLGPEPYRLLGTPVFAIHSLSDSRDVWDVVRNPNLGRLAFNVLVDPWTAWQELDRYLSTELARQVDPPEGISDTLRRDIHGFDDGSFKRGPGGPTRKRKR